jgi:hypothetical protein
MRGSFMRRQLEDSDDWDEGCDHHGCDCGGCHCDKGESDDWHDESGDEDDSTVPCPYCGQEMYEDAPRCPHCGQYISDEDAAPRRKPWWIIIGVLLCLCAVLVWIVMM